MPDGTSGINISYSNLFWTILMTIDHHFMSPWWHLSTSTNTSSTSTILGNFSHICCSIIQLCISHDRCNNRSCCNLFSLHWSIDLFTTPSVVYFAYVAGDLIYRLCLFALAFYTWLIYHSGPVIVIAPKAICMLYIHIHRDTIRTTGRRLCLTYRLPVYLWQFLN